MRLFKFLIIIAVVLLVSCNMKNKNNVNEKASVSALDELPENPLLLSPITFSIDPNQSTMSTLYANQVALLHAKTKANSAYPTGAVLYEVTWKQKADSLWYGANIPSQIIRVERIQFTGDSSPKYELYAGHPLKKIAFVPQTKRINFILAERMVFIP